MFGYLWITLGGKKQNIPLPCKWSVYADDLDIFSKGIDIISIQNHLQTAINNLENRKQRFFIITFQNKTDLIKLCHKQSIFKLSIYNNIISETKTIKFLGLVLDRRLAW